MANQTLAYYDENAETFINGTVNVDMSGLLERFIKHLPEKGRVLDLGCGSGRDSLYFIRKGYDVTSVDGSAEICRQAEKNIGQKVINITFDKLDYENCFDGIWACASLLHLPSDEIRTVIPKIIKAMKNSSVFYCSFKYGEFEGERNGRYFTDYTEESFKELFSGFNELNIIDFWTTEDARPDRSEKWINCIFRKQR